jgi:adenosine tuberculosinyltransferase
MIIVDIKLDAFLKSSDISSLVKAAGIKVFAFPFDGTRRWLQLENPRQNTPSDYERLISQRMTEIFGMVFTHGIETLLAPMVGPDLFSRGGEYLKLATQMLMAFARNSTFLNFYDAFDIRVHFYGDYRRYLQKSGCGGVLDAFDEIVQRTSTHCAHNLCWGIFGQDATAFAIEYACRFQQTQGRLPEKHEIVSAYYGEPLSTVDLYLGFGAPAVFDLPLLDLSNTNLYFTVCPSPYITQDTLRRILYDHIYSRKGDGDYQEFSSTDWDNLREFYRQNQETVLGLGTQTLRGKVWVPTGGIKMSSQFSNLILFDTD